MIRVEKAGDRLTITCPDHPGLTERNLTAFISFLDQGEPDQLLQLIANLEAHARLHAPEDFEMWEPEQEQLIFLNEFLTNLRITQRGEDTHPF